MKMITDSLEKVYTAMGGADDFDKTDIANGIEQISEVAGSGGGSGSNVFKVTFIYDESTGTTSVDKTHAEIKTAIESGQIVIGVDGHSTLTATMVLDAMNYQEYGIAFTTMLKGAQSGQQNYAMVFLTGYIVKTDGSVEDVDDNIETVH